MTSYQTQASVLLSVKHTFATDPGALDIVRWRVKTDGRTGISTILNHPNQHSPSPTSLCIVHFTQSHGLTSLRCHAGGAGMSHASHLVAYPLIAHTHNDKPSIEVLQAE